MAITTYSELQSAVADWLNRADLTARIPDFIMLAEKQISRRLRKVTVRGTLTLTDQAMALPADCHELRSIRLNTSVYRHTLEIGTYEQLTDVLKASAGVPVFATIVNGVLLLDCDPSEDYAAELVYYQNLTPLSDTNTTNDVLTLAPDVYLFGALAAAEPYMKNDERFTLWQNQFNDALTDLDTEREQAETGASLRPIRLPVVFG